MVTELLGGRRYVTFLQKWEGGTSSDRTDFAAYQHAGIHTVKGITWYTYKDLTKTSDYTAFLNMTDAQWNTLYTKYYTKNNWPVDGIKLLLDKYPLIGYNVAETVWMKGPAGAEKLWADFMRKFFQYGPANITPVMIVNFFLDQTTNYEIMVEMMYWWREGDYKGKKHYNGWMNRLNDLYWYFGPKSVVSKLGIVAPYRKISSIE